VAARGTTGDPFIQGLNTFSAAHDHCMLLFSRPTAVLIRHPSDKNAAWAVHCIGFVRADFLAYIPLLMANSVHRCLCLATGGRKNNGLARQKFTPLAQHWSINPIRSACRPNTTRLRPRTNGSFHCRLRFEPSHSLHLFGQPDLSQAWRFRSDSPLTGETSNGVSSGEVPLKHPGGGQAPAKRSS